MILSRRIAAAAAATKRFPRRCVLTNGWRNDVASTSSSSMAYHTNSWHMKKTDNWKPPPAPSSYRGSPYSVIPGSNNSYGSLGEPKSPTPARAWQAEHNSDVQRVTQNAMIYELQQQQTKTIEEVVPWFLQNMPSSYFRQVPEPFRMDHIKAIAAIRDANMDMYLNLKSHTHDGRQVLTFIRPGTQPGTLLHMVEELPKEYYGAGTSDDENGTLPLTRLHVFSSLDESLSLNMFVYGSKKNPLRPLSSSSSTTGNLHMDHILEYAKVVQAGQCADGLEPSPLFEADSLIEYLNKCSDNYLHIAGRRPERLLRQRLMFEEVSGTEGTTVHVSEASTDDEEDAGHYWVDVAVANSLPQVALEHTCRLLFMHKFDVSRSRLDVISDGDNGSVTMLRMLVSPLSPGRDENEMNRTFDLLEQELKRSKWLDPTTMHLVFEKYPWLGVRRGEIITAMCCLMHPIMAKENPLSFSKANIMEALTKPRVIGHAAKIADLFLDRFDPTKKEKMSSEELQSRVGALRSAIESDIEDSMTIELLNKMLEIVQMTMKTNIYMQNRYALGLRLDPRVMGEPPQKEIPYGILFTHGRRFNGFHVRFRDIARGGMRLVTPASVEQYALESARQYEECYGLAFAQQLKNKDIPEGGSKAVNLIDTNGLSPAGKEFVMRKSVKAFTDTILDLILDTPETRENIVDYYGKKEVLYLGPDEQVIPKDINWIIQQAARRGYDTPAAFMSSKPRAGINHKEYGVTSEGVNVYLDVALRRALGIDPTKDSFTIKMTGGPDGDVAGNELKILIREYGENVKIVGIADHSGCAEDENGLNHEESLRLFHAGLCIANFDSSKLSSAGVVHTVDTEEGVKARNSMHNRLKADAFVPAGGRPNTIDITNYKQFILPDGKTPSSPLIVEGANLFVTAAARKALYDEAGVVIVKDSSANKGGVITSSYEICAAMLISEDEFFEHKSAIVEEVLMKLRGFAKMEAELMFREAENYGTSLPEVSQIISNCINTATDALSAALDTLSEEDQQQLLPLFRNHLPPTLAELSFDKVRERVPAQYIKNAISSCLASKMVYKEGTKFIEALPKHKLAAIALEYVQREREITQLINSLEICKDLDEPSKIRIRKLLDAGGARTALGTTP